MNIFTANEEAADFIIEDKGMEAGLLLLRALFAMKRELAQASCDDPCSDDLLMFRELKADLSLVQLHKISSAVPTNNNCKSLDNEQRPQEGFTSMFCFTPGSSWSTANPQVAEAMCAIVMYNAGLAFQREAMRTAHMGLMGKALKMYKQCSTVVTSASDIAATIPLLHLAACSNTAFIYSELNDIKAMNESLAVLSRIRLTGESSSTTPQSFQFQDLPCCNVSAPRRASAA